MTYQPPMPPTNNREALIWLIGQEIFNGGASDVWERAAAILDSPEMAAWRDDAPAAPSKPVKA